MLRHQYFIAILFILGCSASIAMEDTDSRIKFQYFSFSVPDSNTWQLLDKTDNQAVFTTRHDHALYRITIVENYIYDEMIKKLPAKEAADDYRNAEKYWLMELCTRRRMYELRDLTMGDEQIGDNLFYTMKYLTTNPQVYQSARLYLYYPFKKGNNYFLVAHYCEAAPDQSSIQRSYESDFLQLLKSILHHGE